ADGSDLRAVEGTGIDAGRIERQEERLDAVGTGEDEPVPAPGDAVRVDVLREGTGGDDRRFDHVGTERSEAGGKFAGLCAGAGDDDAAASEGPRLEPGEFVREQGDFADDGDNGGL